MSYVERKVVADSKTGYKGVSLEFRKQRTAALEAAHIQERTDRIHCPVLDAARTSGAYGKPIIETCDKKGIHQFSKGIHSEPSKVEFIAYSSGPWNELLSNHWKQQFDESEVNTGFIKSMKKNVHTGILGSGTFEQDMLNQFVWNLFPDLKENQTSINKSFIESSQADGIYITSEHLDDIVDFNQSQSDAFLKTMGSLLSRFEMEELLLGRLGQEITLGSSSDEDDGETKRQVRAVSLRDLHDLYKFGVFPAPIEDSLMQAGLIEEWSLAISGRNSRIGQVKEDTVPVAY